MIYIRKEIFINLTESIKQEAISHSKQRMNYEFNRFNQQDDFRFNMILIGTLGELAFKHYLESLNLSFEMEFQAGEYDAIDFKINNKIVEIKTSGFDSSGYQWLNLLYNSNQYEQALNKGYSYVVQIFVNGYTRANNTFDILLADTAVIVGYIEFDEISKFDITVNRYYSNYKVGLNHLKSIDEIL